MSKPWWAYMVKSAAKHGNKGDKGGAWVLIIIGLFLAPMLVGIPMMLYGFYLLGR